MTRWGGGWRGTRKKPRTLNQDGTPRKKPVEEEHQHQVLFVRWFRHQFPGVLIYAVPNGGDRHPAVAKKLKAEGVTDGIPDLGIPAWWLVIEFKRIKGGRLSDSQKEKRAYFLRHGYSWLTVHGHEDAKQKVQAWLENHPHLPRSEAPVTEQEIAAAGDSQP